MLRLDWRGEDLNQSGSSIHTCTFRCILTDCQSSEMTSCCPAVCQQVMKWRRRVCFTRSVVSSSPYKLLMSTQTFSLPSVSLRTFWNQMVVLHDAWSSVFLPLPLLLSPSLFFSLSSVQHPGLKILRSNSSSSISSRIGWISLTFSLSCVPLFVSFYPDSLPPRVFLILFIL